MPLSIGTRLGPYEVVGLLGSGGMGEVYRASDPRLGRDVAIKVLPLATAGDPQALARFEREARTIAALSHPNLLSVFDFGAEQGIRYTVTELLEGETLRAWLAHPAAGWRRAVEIAAAAAEGLAAAHSRGVVHCDLKPENLFLTSTGRVVILDFGLARWTPDMRRIGATAATLTEAGTLMGTVGYMSPEQARCEAAGPASDLFSLGCVLFELLSGHRAFSRPSPVEILSAILRDEPPPLASTLPVDLVRLVSRCLQKAAEQRIASAAELAAGLRSILAGQPMFAAADAPIESLAVMPFENSSGSADTEFLSDGITESLINSLSRLPNLRVVARSRVFRYKGKEIDPAAVGRELNVHALLTGRVSQRGDALKVQAELVDAVSESQLWGERFQGKFADIFDVEEEIAAQIMRHLRLRLTGEEKRLAEKKPTGNPEAYRLYLQGLHHWNRRTGESLVKGLEYFQQAVDRDPAYALPHHGVAEARLVLSFYNGCVPKESLAKAAVAAERAVALDPAYAPGCAILAMIHAWLDWDWAAAGIEIAEAVEANPNDALVHDRHGTILMAQGRIDEAIALHLKALAMDPLSLAIHFHTAWCFILARQYERAVAQAGLMIELDGGYPLAYIWLGTALERLGRYQEAEAAFQKVPAELWEQPVLTNNLPYLYVATGQRQKAIDLLVDGTERWQHGYVEPYPLALAAIALGEREPALDWLERAAEARSPWFTVHAASDSRLDPVRTHPRFQQLLVRMGLR